MASKRTIKEIVNEIEEIYRDYQNQLNALSKEQEDVLAEFRKTLEEKKIEEIRRSLNK